MVHYHPPLQTAQTPPPLCPKCGSHRTEVVGRSDAGSLVIRCNACGARSEVPVPREPQSQDVANEVQVMLTIARALMELRDPESRTRVLRWATDRIHVDQTVAHSVTSPHRAPTPADPDLAIDEIQDLFADSKANSKANIANAEPAPAKRHADGGVESMIRSLAADFRRLAIEWQGA
jgi:transcription elongation factor Elf1